ncbi:AraC family transcriptional regulator [Paenibacillaceae bacterium WGS1546]|uniref:helix-turn-helix transcriptional regulator n=1 Tax=Cohnella sp. WGS1546 TaxID=3366810 RepID=UPI00372CFE85
MFYLLSRLAKLDVKWANLHKGNEFWNGVEHINPYYELLIVTEGPIYLRIEQQFLTLKSGDVLLLSPWENHTGWKDLSEHAGFFWVQFSTDTPLEVKETWTEFSNKINSVHSERSDLRTLDEREEGVNQLLIPRLFQPLRRYELLRLFEELIHEFKHPRNYFRFRLSLLFGKIIETIAMDVLETYQLNKPLPASYVLYRKLVNWLNESYAMDLSQERIEKMVDRKYEYLCQIFKRYAGITIGTYIQQLRIQRSKHLLRHTDKKIYEICEEVGYRDTFYFSRCFKKFEGVSPSEYRETTIKP